MSKTQYKVEIIVEVENSDWNKVGHARVKSSLRHAIRNALDDAYSNGFLHPEAHSLSITPVSVEVK